MNRWIMGLTAAGLVAATAVFAQDNPFAMQIKARQGNMAYRALNLGVLGAMAKGEAEYDAAKAQKAADNLLAAAKLDASMLWPKGSDNAAVGGTAALPAIWAEGSDIGAKAAAMAEAATAMQSAAGVDLASLQGAMAAVGGACGGCHKAYRQPQN